VRARAPAVAHRGEGGHHCATLDTALPAPNHDMSYTLRAQASNQQGCLCSPSQDVPPKTNHGDSAHIQNHQRPSAKASTGPRPADTSPHNSQLQTREVAIPINNEIWRGVVCLLCLSVCPASHGTQQEQHVDSEPPFECHPHRGINSGRRRPTKRKRRPLGQHTHDDARKGAG